MKIPRPTRRWLQFSLRTLLVFVTLSAIACSWLPVRLREEKREEAAAAAFEKMGAAVMCDKNAAGPAWLRRVLGEHFFGRVKGVFVLVGSLPASRLESLDAMNHLQELDLSNTAITDADLEHLQGLRELRELELGEANVTNAGLEKIAGLEQLEKLQLRFTQVTDAGMEKLARLNKLQTLFLGNENVTDVGLEHLQQMKQLKEVYLIELHATAAGVKKLQQALPNCKIKFIP